MNGYTQINIGGKLRGWKWGKWALEFYMRSLKLKENETVDNVMSSENFDRIAYAGLRMNCYMKQAEPDFTFEDVVNWLEVVHADEVIKINEAIADSPLMKDYMPKKKRGRVTYKKWCKAKEDERGFAFGELNLSHFEYYCLTDFEFYELQKGYQRRRDIELWNIRLMAYPGWNQNSDKPPKMTEWLPIPGLDKTESRKFSKREYNEIQKMVEEYK